MIKNQKDNQLIYDVGMHKGQDTDFYLRKGYKVIGFEANPENAEYCRKRFAEAIMNGKLTIVEGAIVEQSAIANRQTKARFYQNTQLSQWGSISQDWASRNEVMGTTNQIIEVDTVDFTECLKIYGTPHYLKADIVGSEMICLKALLEFENKPDYISIRSEKVVFRKLEEEISLFEQLGYDKFKAIQQDVTDFEVISKTADKKEFRHLFEEGSSGIFGEELPAKWKDSTQIIKEYKWIFARYWLFGDYSFLPQTSKGARFITLLERIFRRSLPGWYDTHAKHSSLSMFFAVLSDVHYLIA